MFRHLAILKLVSRDWHHQRLCSVQEHNSSKPFFVNSVKNCVSSIVDRCFTRMPFLVTSSRAIMFKKENVSSLQLTNSASADL